MNDRIDEATRTLSFVRVLDAAPADVFEAWTRPEELTTWWDPTGAPLVACEVDLRVGGQFRFVNAGHGPPFAGVYTVIERPARLEFDALGARGAVVLEAEGARTRMRVTITCASDEHFATFVRLGVASGTSRTLDQLVARMARPRSGASAH